MAGLLKNLTVKTPFCEDAAPAAICCFRRYTLKLHAQQAYFKPFY